MKTTFAKYLLLPLTRFVEKQTPCPCGNCGQYVAVIHQATFPNDRIPAVARITVLPDLGITEGLN